MTELTFDMIRSTMDNFGIVEQVRKNRFRCRVTSDRVHDAIEIVLASLGCDHLVTISAVDNIKTLELHYHLSGPHRAIISIATDLSREKPEISTSSDILPPAGIYERQIHDLFGISFAGHPRLSRIILNEDWAPGEYPLRKDWSPGPGTFYGGIKKEGPNA